MLFVSRMAGAAMFGVVDTDDGVENICTMDGLKEAVIDNGIDIKGVMLADGVEGPYIRLVIPYQDKRYQTALQAKTKTLQGVEVRVYNREITALLLDWTVLKNGTRVRLSDFGDYMCEYLPIRWSKNKLSGKQVIFVLDDKFEISGESCCIGNAGVVFDISEVTKPQTIEYVYRGLIDYCTVDGDSWLQYLIDKPDRMWMWNCVQKLGLPSSRQSTFEEMFSVVRNKADFCKQVGYAYQFQFTTLAYADMSDVCMHWHEDVKNLLRYCGMVENFDILRERFIGIFDILRRSKNFGYVSVKRFENYIRYFIVPDDIKALYLQLYRNIVSAFRRT